MKFRQAQLKNESAVMTCWIDDGEWNIGVGSHITLKEIPGVIWKVVCLYDVYLEKEVLYKPWRVGGLK